MARARKAAAKANPDEGSTNIIEAGALPPPPGRPKAFFSGMPGNWKPVEEAIPKVVAVRSCIPSLNMGTKVGGVPEGRIITVHGPTHGGKTAFILALVASFLSGGFAVAYIDAEHALDIDFARKLVVDVVGVPLDQLPGYMGKRPTTYEETISHVNDLLRWAVEQRKVHPEFHLLLVVDSINKLTPAKELEAVLKQAATMGDEEEKPAKGGKGGKDKGNQMNKRHGMQRAAMNQAWLDNLVPRLQPAGCTMVLIAQEREDTEAVEFWNMDLMDIYSVKGGAALMYDASLLIRITKVRPVKESDAKDADVLAWEHNIRIWKSKVGSMEGRFTDARFFIRLDGTLDTARNHLHTGIELGVVQKSDGSSWLSYGKIRVNGEKQMVARLDADKALMARLASDVAMAVDKACGRPVAA